MTIVGLLGTIHNEELRAKYNCTLSLYKDLSLSLLIGLSWMSGKIPFNSDKFDQVTKEKYDWLFQINPTAQNMRWVIRNQIMIQRVKNTYEKNPGKRILCTVGADHNYFFREELMKEPITLQYPLR